MDVELQKICTLEWLQIPDQPNSRPACVRTPGAVFKGETKATLQYRGGGGLHWEFFARENFAPGLFHGVT